MLRADHGRTDEWCRKTRIDPRVRSVIFTIAIFKALEEAG